MGAAEEDAALGIWTADWKMRMRLTWLVRALDVQ